MENKNNLYPVIFRVTGAVAGWFALVVQFIILIQLNVAPLEESVIRYFSFFTVLTNILAAFCFTALLINPHHRFFSAPGVLTAITVYMLVVGLIYNIVLRALWQPEGWQRVVDELIHLILPLLFFVYWILYVPGKSIRWKIILPGLLYPLIYCVAVLLRGRFSGFYPYPFIDVYELGYHKVFINIGWIILVFLVMFILLIGTAKRLPARHKNVQTIDL